MWQSIETAPKTGEHILGADFTPGRVGFGMCGGKHQSMMTTVHWWNNPGEEGWYISCSQNDSSEPFPATHWQPLIELAAHAPKQEPSVPVSALKKLERHQFIDDGIEFVMIDGIQFDALILQTEGEK